MISTYVQYRSMNFPFNSKPKENLKVCQLISTYFQYRSMIFSFNPKPKRNLKVSKDVNWYQPTFNVVQWIFLLIQNPKEIWRLVRMSIDINLLSIFFNDFFFNPKPKRNLTVSKDFNWYQPTFNIFQYFFL